MLPIDVAVQEGHKAGFVAEHDRRAADEAAEQALVSVTGFAGLLERGAPRS